MNIELRLITLLARSYHSDRIVKQINELSDESIDWHNALELMQHHRVSALCLNSLRKLALPRVPSSVIHALQAECKQHTGNALILMNAAREIITCIQSAHIEVVCFKGIVAAQLIYGQLSMRNFGDIDLYVRQKDHAATEVLLSKNGFHITNRHEGSFQSSLRDEQKGVNIDLHWKIPPRELDIPSGLLWDNISSIDIHQQAIPTFGLNDTILITAVNALKEYWSSRLYRFCDLAELIHSHPQPDWNRIFNRAKQLGLQNTLFTALIVCEKLLSAPIPREISAVITRQHKLSPIVDELVSQIELVEQTNSEANYRKTRIVPSDKHYFLALQDTWPRKWQFWLKWALTPTAADREFLLIPTSLSALYYLLRPIRLLFSKRPSR